MDRSCLLAVTVPQPTVSPQVFSFTLNLNVSRDFEMDELFCALEMAALSLSILS